MSEAHLPETAAADDSADAFNCSQLGVTAEDYEFGSHLGDGGFGRVYQATCRRTGKPVAIKVLDKRKVHQRNMTSRVISEISIHQQLRHQFVLQLYSYFEDTTNVYLVLELCQQGNLHDYVRRNGCLSEEKVRYFLKQIVTGLCYLHRNRIIHRDLTLANLLLTDDYRVKISDFGLATELSDDRTNKTMCGTPNYISPEVSSQGVQGPEVDVWSLGVMLYTMLVGKAPFDTKDPKSTIDNARRLKYDIPGSLQPEAIDLIAKLLRERPKERLTLAQVLEHPFMRKAHERNSSNDSGNDSLQSGSHCLAASTPIPAASDAATPATSASLSLSRQSQPRHPQLQPLPHHVEHRAQQPPAASTPHLQAASKQRPAARQPMINGSSSLRRCNSDGRQVAAGATLATGGHSRHSEGYSSAVQSDGSPSGPQAAPRNFAQRASAPQPPLDPVEDVVAACIEEDPPSCASNPASSVGSQRRSRLPQTPLSTVRLEPCRVVKGPTVFSLAADGSLTVEQFKVGGRSLATPRRVLRIEPDGRQVALLSDQRQQQQQQQQDFDWSAAEKFSFPDLSDSAARLYQLADAFVGILRSNTAKLVLHTDRARCVLFENSAPEPDFAVYFYSGRRAARRNGGLRVTIDGKLVELRTLAPDEAEIVHYVNETYEQVRRIESVLSGVSMPGRSCFPATIGRAPANEGLEPATVSAQQPQQPLQVADVQQLSESDTRVLFSDGSLLEIRQDCSEQLRSLDYTDPFGHRQRLESNQRRPLTEAPLPAEIQRRLGLLLLGKPTESPGCLRA